MDVIVKYSPKLTGESIGPIAALGQKLVPRVEAHTDRAPLWDSYIHRHGLENKSAGTKKRLRMNIVTHDTT